MKVAGIYRIVSPSGNCYVGSSNYIVGRFCRHRSELRGGKHHAKVLQSAANKYGVDALRFEPIFSVFDSADLLSFEQHFIDELKPEYNSSCVAESTSRDPLVAARISQSARASKAHAAARSKNQQKASAAVSRPVVRLTDGANFPSGYDAARAVSAATPDNLFTAIARGNKFCGHYWKYAGDSLSLKQAVANAKAKSEAGAIRSKETMIANRQKGVTRLSDGVMFSSIAGAARAIGCNHSAIHRALREGTNCKGSGWSYV